ncbi:MAG: manganese efflux pump [Hornefia sp.]|nr:manganese efflux pump [Hornefia sp.]
MSSVDILLLGIALSMDAMAVTLANGMVYHNSKKIYYFAMPLLFGGFQMLMPYIGFKTGSIFYSVISKYSGVVIFIILSVVGGKMIFESFGKKEEKNIEKVKNISIFLIFVQAIATSIDAFAVGVGFVVANINIFKAVCLIGITTSVITTVSIFIGRKFGDIFGNKSEIVGGLILIIIGVKALLRL